MSESPARPYCMVDENHPEMNFIFVHDCLTYLDEGSELTPLADEHRALPLEGVGRRGWVWVGEPGKTIHPSIDCGRCGTHGFWIDGEWRPVK